MPSPNRASRTGLIDLDGFFGLHPRAAALAPLFKKGQAVALQAVGYDLNTRSHFEEQDTWETGVSGNTLSSDGWLNRHLLTSQGHGPIRAVSIGDTLPRILRGKAPAFAVRGITDLGLFPQDNKSVKAPDQARIAAALEHAYCCDPRVVAAAQAVGAPRPTLSDEGSARDLLASTAQTTFDGMEQLKAVTSKPYTPAAKYPDTDLGRKLEQVARLIKSDLGMEVAEVDYGSWDTHQNQGGSNGGQYANLVGGLADGLAAFAADLENRLDDVLVVTLSDFGRTAAENGTGGTDHGWANCMFAMGGPILAASPNGPRNVLGRWPGPAPRATPSKTRPPPHDGFPRRARRTGHQAPGQPEPQDGPPLSQLPVGRPDLSRLCMVLTLLPVLTPILGGSPASPLRPPRRGAGD